MSLWGLFFLRSQRWPCILNLARKLSALLLISIPGVIHEEKGSVGVKVGIRRMQMVRIHPRMYGITIKI